MKRLLSSRVRIWALVLASLAVGNSALAVTELNVSGQVRFRNEFDRRKFSSRYKLEPFSYLRTRVNIDAKVNDNAQAFVQFQDSRTLGGTTFMNSNQSATLNNGRNVDVHQAYLKIDNLLGQGWGAMAGRFEVNLGNERTFGAVGWDNVGRAWEGATGWYDNESFKITGLALKAVETKNLTGNRDFDVYGFNVDVRKARASFFALLERNAQRDNVGRRKFNRLNLGGYIKQRKDRFDFEANAVYQGGTISTDFASGSLNIVKDTIVQTPTTGSEMLDIKAYMVAAEIGYNFPGSRNVRFAVGADIASGDGNSSDTDYKSYNNLYYTGHKFRGYMDYFLKSNFGGLMDLMFRGKFDATRGWVIKGDVHYFKTMQDYVDYNALATSDVGFEVDLSVVTTRVKGAKIVNGLSFFLPEDSFAGTTNNNAGIWGYTQVIVNF